MDIKTFIKNALENYYELLKNNIYAILLALIIGLIFVSPHFLMMGMQKDAKYTPLVINQVDALSADDLEYAVSIRDVYDGHVILGDPILYESKNNSTPFPTFSLVVLGLMTHITGSVENTFIIGDFIFPVIIVILLYILILKFTDDKIISLAGSSAVILGIQITEYFPFFTPERISSFVSTHITEVIRPFNYFARLPYTQFVFPILIIAILMLYLSIKYEKIKCIIASGVISGLLFYSYFYYWTAFTASLFFLFIIYILKRDIKKIKIILYIGIIALLIASPYLLNFLNSSSEVLGKTGIEMGRAIAVPTFTFAISLIVFYFVIRSGYISLGQKNKHELYLMTALFLGGLTCINIQLITSYTVQPYHWTSTFLGPAFIIFLFYAFYIFINTDYKNFIKNITLPLKKHYVKIMLIIVLILVVHAIVHNIMFSVNNKNYFVLDNEKIDTFGWLNKNTPKDSVVLTASIEMNTLIPVYTHNNVFLPDGIVSTVSTEETIKRSLITYKILNVSEGYLEVMLENNYTIIEYYENFSYNKRPDKILIEKALWNSHLFHMKFYFFKYTPENYTFPKDIKKEIMEKGIYYFPEEVQQDFKNVYSNLPSSLPELLKYYRIDYIYFGPYEKSIANRDFSKDPTLEIVWGNDNVTIFKVKKI